MRDTANQMLSMQERGTWLAQSVVHATLDLRVVNSRLTLGMEPPKKT